MFPILCEGGVAKKASAWSMPLGLQLARQKCKDVTTAAPRQIKGYKSSWSSPGASWESDIGGHGSDRYCERLGGV